MKIDFLEISKSVLILILILNKDFIDNQKSDDLDLVSNKIQSILLILFKK